MNSIFPESLIYTSTLSKVPFSIETKGMNRHGETITLHTLASILRKEELLNGFIDNLDNDGWMNYIQVDELSSGYNEVEGHTFTFRADNRFKAKAFREELSNINVPLFSYNLIKGRVYFEKGTSKELLADFYKKKYPKGEQAQKTIDSISHKGLSILDALEHLNFVYEHYKAEAAATHSSIIYTKELHVKLLSMQYIAEFFGYHSSPSWLTRSGAPNNRIDLILGDASLWLPYLANSVSLDNVAYTFCHTIEHESLHGKFEAISLYEAAWDKKAPYTPEQLQASGDLPHAWFKELYPNPNLLD